MRKASIVPALTIALSVSIGACEPDKVIGTAEDVATAGEAPFDFGSNFELTSEQIAEVRRRLVASLPVDDLGRIDIVDAGVDGTPRYVYVSVGRPGVHEVLDQLDEQGATPAEVFLAMAPREQTVPDVLLRDHDERAARGEASADGPRRLESDFVRATLNVPTWRDGSERSRRDCYSGHGVEPEPFASWVDAFRSWSSGYVHWATHGQHSTTVEHQWYPVKAKSARAMSACNAASSTGELTVAFGVSQARRNPYDPASPPMIFYVANDLGEFDSARHKSVGGPWTWYIMIIKQSFPPPRRAYVAYGNCGAGGPYCH